MYHWYLLLRGVRSEAPGRGGPNVGFTAGHDADPVSSLSHPELRRLLTLGAIEAAPLWLAPVVGALVPVDAPPGAWWVVGAAGCATLCWLLRDRAPQMPIHTAGPRAGSGGERRRRRAKRAGRP